MKIDIDEYAEGAILLDDLEEAIIGIVEEFGNGRRILYSKSKIFYQLIYKFSVEKRMSNCFW
jgi:hypothetical protein